MIRIKKAVLFLFCTYCFTANANLINGNNTLACNLYRELQTKQTNLFFSPYSISSALSMAYSGASGETRNEMRATLFENKKPMQFTMLKSADNGPVQVANKIFIEKTFDVKDSFQQSLEENFGAPCKKIDTSDPIGSAAIINDWVSQKTYDNIQDIVSPRDIIPYCTKLAIVNAIYFKADWEKPFSKANTSEAPFLTSNGEFHTVNMMDQTTKINYTENDILQAIELPYKESNLSMVVMLPKQREELSLVEQSLSREAIASITSSMQRQKVVVRIPKFKLETVYKNLKDSFCALGMSRPFSRDAEFLHISNTQLHISKIIHKAFIEVEETGTEAAAATVVIVNRTAAFTKNPLLPKIFNADHPFLFMIRDRATGLILFMGRVERP